MKISELINLLEKTKEKHGDIVVKIGVYDVYHDYVPVKDVYINLADSPFYDDHVELRD